MASFPGWRTVQALFFHEQSHPLAPKALWASETPLFNRTLGKGENGEINPQKSIFKRVER